MPDAVEPMAYTHEVPWHSLGTYVAKAPTVEDMLTLAQLNWEVHKQPIQFVQENGEAKDIQRFYALVRDTDNTVFDIAGEIYTPCQNREAFEFFVDFIEDGDATISNNFVYLNGSGAGGGDGGVLVRDFTGDGDFWVRRALTAVVVLQTGQVHRYDPPQWTPARPKH